MKINIAKILLDIENKKSTDRILLHTVTEYPVEEFEKEYFNHLKNKNDHQNKKNNF